VGGCHYGICGLLSADPLQTQAAAPMRPRKIIPSLNNWVILPWELLGKDGSTSQSVSNDQGCEMKISSNWLRTIWIPITVVVLGIGLRFLAATRGYNYDFDSFLVVINIVKHGGNVYAETTRYNYGPVWFNILLVLHNAASVFQDNHERIFRYIITGLLSLVDIGIFSLLWKKTGRLAAVLFFLNPISIIITGYHRQFENLALFLGLAAVILFGDDCEKPLNPRKLVGLMVLGISLMTKHILFAFPLWLAVKQKGFWNKVLVIIVPISVFILGFVPYWNGGQQGILQNVLTYQSFNNQYFFRLFVPEMLHYVLNAYSTWIILLGIFAVAFRRRTAYDSILLYSCVLVAASPAIANQYLAIVVPFIAANPNFIFLFYTIIGTWHLMVDSDGLHIAELQSVVGISTGTYFALLVFLLCLGFIWHLWRQGIVTFLKKGMLEIKDSLT
jgi:hypothetical protein